MKLYLSALLVGFAILLAPNSAEACSCLGRSPFMQVASRSQLIVRARVIQYIWEAGSYKQQERQPLAMLVEVKERFKGSEKSRQMMIWGDNGMQCRPYVSQFPIGTEWIFAVSHDNAQKDWAISACGEYWLRLRGETVTGQVTTPNPQSMSLVNFRKLLKKARS